MNRHTEHLVGALFRVLEQEGHTEAREILTDVYQSHAHTARDDLVAQLVAELVTIVDRQLGPQDAVDVLTTTVEYLVHRFVDIIEVAPVAIVVVDGDASIQLWNDGAEQLFGWDEATVLTESYPDLLVETPDTTETIRSRLRDGTRLTGVETRHRHADGSVRDVRLWAAPLSNQPGGVSGATIVATDITTQKQREQRLAVLDRVLRHNIRNDVTVIRGHLDLIAEVAPAGDDHVAVIDDRLADIVDLSEKARHIEQLRADTEADLVTHDLCAVLRDRLDRLRNGRPAATIRTTVPGSVRVVAHELLPYALDNLLENAVEHNPAETPRVFVDVSTTATETTDTVTVEIEDDGPGLSDYEARIFTAETETPLAHSTGMGLWLARWIVRSSGGQITIDTGRFDGTCVRLELRRATAT